MLKSIADDVRQQFDSGNMITRLVIINVVIFIAINLVQLGFTITAGFQYDPRFDDVVRYLSVNADIVFTATHPWVLITHMFLHIGFWHFLFNMLFLYWFGRIVGDMIGDHRVVPLYLMAGLFGALVYLITAPLMNGAGTYAYGASASVMGIVMASGMIAPNYVMHLLLIGEVKLKYIVLALIFLDLVGIASLSNTGGHVAHLGGVVFGIIYISALRRGNDFAVPVNRFFDWFLGLFRSGFSARKRKRSSDMFVRHSSAWNVRRRPSQVTTTGSGSRRQKSSSIPEADHQERLDAILDKIKEKGYDSLSDEEKEFLFLASKK